MRDLVIPALNLALVSFVSLMLTARSFAAKNGYEINADAEFRALGIANLMSGLSQGLLSVEPIPEPQLMIQLGEKSAGFLSQPYSSVSWSYFSLSHYSLFRFLH
jgi:hypothetical protein